ncbi:heavy metal-binding domain-containing protein [Oceaniglobus trochenteri]|uniref:heavy metal-binding domain-containing protein n=1 Tax=Oceaniglobus trochenteri TaxID=2763260 RepID=UPI003CC92850
MLEAAGQASHKQAQATRNRAILLTTETHIGEVERLGIVASEVVLGMNLFKDALANLRDIFGGRSGTVQKTLAEAREAAFEDLRLKAADLGGDAVVAVDIDYHSLSTSAASTNMLIVAVSGTAVRMGEKR